MTGLFCFLPLSLLPDFFSPLVFFPPPLHPALIPRTKWSQAGSGRERPASSCVASPVAAGGAPGPAAAPPALPRPKPIPAGQRRAPLASAPRREPFGVTPRRHQAPLQPAGRNGGAREPFPIFILPPHITKKRALGFSSPFARQCCWSGRGQPGCFPGAGPWGAGSRTPHTPLREGWGCFGSFGFWGFFLVILKDSSGLSRAHSWAAGTLPILPVLPVRSLGGGFEAGITEERGSLCGGEWSRKLPLAAL